MSAALFQLKPDQSPQKRWWNNQELAEFYRVSDIMAQAGLEVESESGVSDEGEPWFVFVRSDTGEVIAHFAIIDGAFIAVSSVTQDLYRGTDIRNLIDQLVDRHPMMTPPSSNGKVVLHPSIILTAFVAAAFVAATEEVRANTLDEVLEAALSLKNSDKSNSTKETFETASAEETTNTINEDSIKETNTEIVPTFHDFDAGKTFGSSFALLGAVILALEISSRETALANTQQVKSSVNFQMLADLNIAEYVPVPDFLTSNNPLTANDINFNDISNLGNDSQFQEPILNSFLSLKKSNLTLTTDLNDLYRGIHVSKMTASDNIVNSADTVSHSNSDFMKHHHLDDQSLSQTAIIDSNLFFSSDTQQANKTLISENSEQKISLVAIDVVSLVSGTANNTPQPANTFPHKLTNNISINDNNLDFYSLENSLITSFSSGTINRDLQNPIDKERMEDKSSNTNPIEREIKLQSDNIKGHIISPDSSQSLVLDSSIDILLYEGGDVSVSNFELGKDRVWFFLSEGKMYESYQITDANDLVLEFETGDTLTLLGVLDTEAPSLVI